MKKLFSLALAIIGLYACLNLSSCKKEDDEPNGDLLIGTWVRYGAWDAEIDDYDTYYYVFNENGDWSYYYNGDYQYNNGYYEYGQWSHYGTTLEITYQGYYEDGVKHPEESERLIYTIKTLDKNELVIIENDGFNYEEKFSRYK